ncbi:G-protein coupled receptor Mth2-like isoform X7 [Onthophagus taurus]|uniref:G-protein coupled receptor Mth2-like isoform X7 n=1 Tax=Onthophagus taurus TaxID=166361 RepID=UPI000C20368B|nr:G-protein coupled receptor Mth2-like isoform X7 [Onthophagus taurus]
MFCISDTIRSLILLYLQIHYTSSKIETLCDFEDAVDITYNSTLLPTGEIFHEGIKYPQYYTFVVGDRFYGCVCFLKGCVQKCCKNDEIFVNKTCMRRAESESISNLQVFDGTKVVGVVEKSLYVFYGTRRCAKSEIKLDPNVCMEDEYYLQSNGDLFMPYARTLSYGTFCIDRIEGEEEFTVIQCVYYDEERLFTNGRYDGSVVSTALNCNPPPSDMNVLYSYGMIISMPFLIATFLVYALLPDKNLPAKSLMCYVLSLLFAYIMLVTIQLNSNLEHGACVTIAYLCYFFFMVSFFWMNSSCIDIWLTFSGIKGITGQRTQERKRFIYYCLYSWGLPLIMTSIVVVMTMEHLKDSIFFTAIGDGQCWFKNGLSTGIYFYFPIAILLITNIVLFAITALKIRNVQRDTKVLNAKDSSKHEKDKQRFNLYIKLLFAMGVNWSMEVISWLVQWQSNNVPTYIWYITDFCNAMYGVLIFFIFVFKKNIWIMLKKRYLQIMGRSTRAHSMGTSTHRTTLFTAISLQSIPGAGLLTKMHSTPNDNRNELRPPKIH